MYVLEKQRKKFNDKAWQGIFVGYKGKNLYKIYYSLTRKIYKIWDVDINKKLLYNKSKTNL